MSYQILVLVAVHAIVIAAAPTEVQEHGIKSLVNIGKVGSKSYFIDNTLRTWEQAKAFCESSGLYMSTIKDSGQADFLKGKIGISGFQGVYFLGARDAQIARALSWYNTYNAPESFSGLGWKNHIPSFQLCGTFNAVASDKHQGINFCAEKHLTLCQN
ncbi:unnamed protein product [Orchesella dallaii]|uniref:C-type lectin domain-containing protein n=1 Tax=Orchesella dallaii TaxID=48710 RepID=A0ABP1R894_9HEXA